MTAKLFGKDLCLLRGDRCLFQHLSFALSSGELLLVEGRNGCGKTSLLRAVAGLLEFESGRVDWNGQSIISSHQAFRSDLVWLSHKVGFKGDLTLVENLSFETGLRATTSERLQPSLDRLGLAPLTDLPFRALSAGQQRRVGLARMLIAKARLWMMDEPFTNLDTGGQALVREVMAEHLARDGLCVVASHQNIDVNAPVRRVQL